MSFIHLSGVTRVPFLAHFRPRIVGKQSGSVQVLSSELLPVLVGRVARRPITQQHRRRMREAESQWLEQADEIENGQRKSFLSMLEERGLVNNIVGDRNVLDELFTKKRVGIYSGVDPTGPSLHVGHMLPFMVIGWAYIHGYKAVYLLGGSTARFGDPTGRLAPRESVSSATRKANMANMHLQLKKLGMSIEKYATKYGYQREWAWRRAIVNNNTWWNKRALQEVLNLMGRYARLGTMLGRDSVKNRMKQGEGMSLAEFCYPLMQAWDWWELFRLDVRVQVGGSDQEGNILFGSDLIKAMLKEVPVNKPEESKYAPVNVTDNHPTLSKPIGFTTPLLTNSSGEKIGKSTGNAIWLDKDMTPVSELYQHFMRISDEDVERYLKMFTFMPIPQIQEVMKKHQENVTAMVAQSTLAFEFVELIHGRDQAIAAEREFAELSKLRNPNGPIPASVGPKPPIPSYQQQTNAFNSTSPHLTLPRSLVVGQYFHKVLWSAGMVGSKAEGYRLITNNGAAVASRADSRATMDDALSYIPIRPWGADVTEKFIIDGSLLILRAGKWKVKIIKVVPDEEFEEMGLSAPGWDVEESPQERATDEALVQGTGRIAGRRVRRPAIADESQD